jgi:hypothetical protein
VLVESSVNLDASRNPDPYYVSIDWRRPLPELTPLRSCYKTFGVATPIKGHVWGVTEPSANHRIVNSNVLLNVLLRMFF